MYGLSWLAKPLIESLPWRSATSHAQPLPNWPTAARPHDRPEDRVVGVAARVVADRGADVLGNRVDPPEQVFHGLAGQLGMLFQGRVRIRHISRVVLVVMDLHCLGVDV